MKFLRLTHVLRAVMTFILLAGATLIGSPSASALPYAECNSGWAVMVEVAGGNGGGAYVPAYSSHAGSTRGFSRTRPECAPKCAGCSTDFSTRG